MSQGEKGQEDMNSVIYTVEEVARLLGISRGLAYEGVRRGEIPAVRIGKRLLVPRAALLKMLEGVGHAGGRNG